MSRDPRSFIVETQDYKMDFVVGAWTGSVSSSNYDPSVLEISHSLGYAPLIFGMYSVDNGSTWMPIGLNDYYATQTDCWAEADSSKIYVTFTSLASSSKTAQLKLWGLMPTTADAANATPAQTNVFTLNTRDFNYSKLVAAGRWGASTGSVKIYEHGLGYVPEVLVWAEKANGRVVPFDPSYSENTNYVARQQVDVTTTAIWSYLSTLDFRDSTISAIHYRIYGAQNG